MTEKETILEILKECQQKVGKKFHDHWSFKLMMAVVAGVSTTILIALYSGLGTASKAIKAYPQLQKNDSISTAWRTNFEVQFTKYVYCMDKRLYMDSVTNSNDHAKLSRDNDEIKQLIKGMPKSILKSMDPLNIFTQKK